MSYYPSSRPDVIRVCYSSYNLPCGGGPKILGDRDGSAAWNPKWTPLSPGGGIGGLYFWVPGLAVGVSQYR